MTGWRATAARTGVGTVCGGVEWIAVAASWQIGQLASS
jgi:hypothetical protein